MVRPARRVGRPPGVVVVLGVAGDRCAVRKPGHADDEDHAVGEAQQRLDGGALGLHRPLLGQLATERRTGVLTGVDGAAGAERPASRPARHPGRALTRQPAAVARANDAHRGHALRRVGRIQAQRPAHRLDVELEQLGGGPQRHEAGADAVVRGRAAVAERGDRGVGGGRRGRRRLVALVAPVNLHLVELPRAAGNDAGTEVHRRHSVLGASVTGRGTGSIWLAEVTSFVSDD